jgi:hypothetical protein
MPTCTMTYHSSEPEVFRSGKELEEALAQINLRLADQSLIIVLTHENNTVLTFGISAEGCFVQYSDESNDPPYYASAGDPAFAQETGVTVFYLDGHDTEISKRQLIKFADLLRVILYFFEHGTHPAQLIDWEIV